MFHFPQVKQFMTFLDFRRPLLNHTFLQLFNLFPVIFISLSYLLIPRFHVVINSGGPLSVRSLNICTVLFLQVILILLVSVLHLVEVSLLPFFLIHYCLLPQPIRLDIIAFGLLVKHVIVDILKHILEVLRRKHLDV